MKRQVILVIGYDGYIGFPLTLRLLTEGHVVYGIDNYSRRKNVEEIGSISATNISTPYERRELLYKIGNFTHKDLDIIHNDDLVNSLIKRIKPNTIINLGHNPSAPYSQIDKMHANYVLNNNIIGTNNLLWAIKEHCPDCHYLTIGSTGEYNHSINVDIEEGYFNFTHNKRKSKKCLFPREANSIYHVSKISSTYLIDYLARLWGLRCTDVMQSVVFGIYTPECEKWKEYTRLDTDECFLPGTDIYTPNGISKIENMNIGDIVYTHKGNKKNIKDVIINDYDGIIYNVDLKHKINFKCTPTHPFLVSTRIGKKELSTPKWHTIEEIYDIINTRKYKKYDNQMDQYYKSIDLRKDGYTYREISEKLNISYNTIISWLSKGQKPRIIINKEKTFKNDIFFTIPIPKEGNDKVSVDIQKYIGYGVVKNDYIYTENPSNKEKIWGEKHKIKNNLDFDDLFCLLSGYYIAEGSACGSKITFSFHKDEHEYHQDVVNIIKSKFNKDIKIETNESNGVSLTTNSKILRLLFNKLFGCDAHNKQIPSMMMDMDNNNIKHLIKGYWRGDGYYTHNGGCKYNIGMTSVSENLLKQIKLLLLRFGIISTIHKRERCNILSFKNRDDYKFDSITYDLIITGESARIFLKDIVDMDNINYPIRYDDYLYKDNDYIYIGIDNIEVNEYTGKTYNFEVQDDESYMTPVSSHNCYGTVVNRFVIQALLGLQMTVYGNGMHSRAFLSLNDSMQALMIAVNNPAEPGVVQTWNQLSEWHSINDIAKMVKGIIPNSKIINIESPRKEFTGGHYYNYKTDKLKKLGYMPTRTIKDEIRYIVENVNVTDKIDVLKNIINPKIIF